MKGRKHGCVNEIGNVIGIEDTLQGREEMEFESDRKKMAIKERCE